MNQGFSATTPSISLDSGSNTNDNSKKKSNFLGIPFNNTITNFISNNSNENAAKSKIFQSLAKNILNTNMKTFNSINYSNNANMNNNDLNFNQTSENFSMIKLSGKSVNLKSAMDSLDLIPETNEIEMDAQPQINNIDLFKNNKISNIKFNNKERYSEDIESIKKLEQVNEFNKTILKTNNWGTLNVKLSKEENNSNNTYYKPHKKAIEREVGQSILNTKLPRARLPTNALERQNFNKISKAVNKKSEWDSLNEKSSIFNSTSLNSFKGLIGKTFNK